MTKPIPPEIEKPLQAYLQGIARLFLGGHVTIIVRAPEGNTVGDLVLSNDNPTKVLNILRQHMVAHAEHMVKEAEANDRKKASPS